MNFYIQASNPRTKSVMNFADKTLSDAIESSFLLNTENAILMWNHISIPLSYKYDISYMMGDLLKLLQCLQGMDSGEMVIHWLPDTFRCNWSLAWSQGQVMIQSKWECVVGHLEKMDVDIRGVMDYLEKIHLLHHQESEKLLAAIMKVVLDHKFC